MAVFYSNPWSPFTQSTEGKKIMVLQSLYNLISCSILFSDKKDKLRNTFLCVCPIGICLHAYNYWQQWQHLVVETKNPDELYQSHSERWRERRSVAMFEVEEARRGPGDRARPLWQDRKTSDWRRNVRKKMDRTRNGTQIPCLVLAGYLSSPTAQFSVTFL